jgi:hypothetical protein
LAEGWVAVEAQAPVCFACGLWAWASKGSLVVMDWDRGFTHKSVWSVFASRVAQPCRCLHVALKALLHSTITVVIGD